MSSELLQLQQSWLRAMIDPGSHANAAASQCNGGLRSAAAGLAIYVNNVRATILRALAASFPATRALLGEPAFRRAVSAYLYDTPPRSGDLGTYGEGFPQYAAVQAYAHRKQVIAEVARYEWLSDQLPRMAREKAWPLACAATLDPRDWPSLRLRLVSHARLVRSPVRVRAWILQALADTRLPEEGDERLLLVAGDEDVEVLDLDSAQYAFALAIAASSTLELATNVALAVDPGFDLRALLERLFVAEALALVTT